MDIWLSKERLEAAPLPESTGIELVSDLLEIVEAFQRDGQPPPGSLLRLLAKVPRFCGITRTCHNLTRTSHNLTRTCHNLTRT